MAPEWTQTVDRTLTRQASVDSSKSFQSLQKLDIFALGIILSDLICNPTHDMEIAKITDALKSSPPRLPVNFKLENLTEG